MSHRLMTWVAAACLWTSADAIPQERPRTNDEQAKDAPKTRAGVDQQFDRRSPGIGAALPDLAAYDADGKEVRLGSLKGQYTVLVFGCLT